MQNEVPCLCAYEESASCKPKSPLAFLHLAKATVPARALRAVLLLWAGERKVWRTELQHGQGHTQTRREERLRVHPT